MNAIGIRLFVAAAFALLAGAAAAQSGLTFEGLQDSEAVLNFYNAGTGGSGSGPGQNFGASFSSNAMALIERSQGGTGNFTNEPSPKTVLFFLTGGSAIMSVPAGFTTGFSFFYSSTMVADVKVYDGPNATGNLLATIPLAANDVITTCVGATGRVFCNWTPVGTTFSGTAKSIDFGGTANEVGYDNITIGSSTPIPPPGSLSINDVSGNEGNSGNTPFVFTVTLSSASASTVTVNYATADGTAVAGSDYVATSGTLTFNPGVLTQTITVNVIGDTASEPNETFFVNLSGATNATIAKGQGIGTILNDDVVVSAVPTMDEWALVACALLLAASAILILRRRRR